MDDAEGNISKACYPVVLLQDLLAVPVAGQFSGAGHAMVVLAVGMQTLTGAIDFQRGRFAPQSLVSSPSS